MAEGSFAAVAGAYPGTRSALRGAMDVKTAASLPYPFPPPPAPGDTIEVAPGILWIRMPLPFRLNHVNIFLIDDGDGWAVLDAGIGNDTTRSLWEALVTGPL